DIELRTPTPSFTSLTLKKFHARGYGPGELFFILGADAFADIASWRDYPSILRDANFAAVSRPGFNVDRLPRQLPALAHRRGSPPPASELPEEPGIVLIDAPTADVSSTAIRQRRGAGDAINGLVPLAVQQHIEQHGLYTSTPPGRRAMDAAPPPQAGRLHGQD